MEEGFDERALMQGLRDGDQSAFRQLYGIYSPRLYLFSKRFQLDPEDAREIVQETFIRAWEHRTGIRPGDAFGPYLFTIARNLVYNFLRRATYWEKYLRDVSLGQQAAQAAYAPGGEHELQRLIGQAMQQLPDKCRQIFWKSRYEGFSNQEIADDLAISKSTVENQLNKALRSIRKFLESNGYGPALLLVLNFIQK